MKNKTLLIVLLIVISSLRYSFSQTTDKPNISLMVWDEKANEGSSSAEFILYQVGSFKPGLTVRYKTSGTARNGYDYKILEKVQMRNSQTSIKIKPIENLKLTGNKTVTITLLPDSTYSIDPKNSSKTITIQDSEMPVVEFLLPGSMDRSLPREISTWYYQNHILKMSK